MSKPIRLVGEIPEDDPRVQAAMAAVENDNGSEADAAEALIPAFVGFERYGLKLRPQSLMQSALVARIQALGELDALYQPWILLFLLAADLKLVYSSIDKAKKAGPDAIAQLMADIHQWFNDSGIPTETTQEVIDAAAESFQLAARLAPKVNDDGGLKKNPDLGS